MKTHDFMATGEAIAPGTVRIERLLPGPAERLWNYLTDSEKRRLWLAAGGMELFPGGKVELLFRHRELSSEPTPDRYKHYETSPAMVSEVIECDPPRLITYSWPGDGGKSEVTFELFPEGSNVRLVLTHRRLEGAEIMISVASGWEAHLGILEDRLSGREPRGFWSTHARLEREYAKKNSRSGGDGGIHAGTSNLVSARDPLGCRSTQIPPKRRACCPRPGRAAGAGPGLKTTHLRQLC